jgi:RHS repeat-associated protein
LDDGTTSYIYGPSSAPIAQVDDSTGTVQYLHGDLIGSTRLITSASGTVQYLHGDLIGSTRLITSASGTVVGTSKYDSYGNRTGHTGTADSAIGYSGALTDLDTGLVYLQARDYDPATAQFLTVDPLVDTTRQAYTYVADNPLNNSDPTGLCDKPGLPNIFQLVWAAGVAQFNNIANSSVLHSIVDAYASFGNAMINHPDLAWQLLGGLAGVVGGGVGEVGLGACDATIVGTVPCVAGGVGVGALIVGSAGVQDQVAKLLASRRCALSGSILSTPRPSVLGLGPTRGLPLGDE